MVVCHLLNYTRYFSTEAGARSVTSSTGGSLKYVNVLARKVPVSYPNNQQYQYPNYPNVQQNNSLEFFHGSKFKEKSVIFGVIGFFFLGIVFGPLAISNAKKAEALHHSATVGKVLGWIDTIAGVVWIAVFLLIFIAAASSSGA